MHGCRAWLAKGGDLDLRKPGLLCSGEGRGGGRGGRAGEVRDVKQLSPDYLTKRINSNQSLWQGGGGRQSPPPQSVKEERNGPLRCAFGQVITPLITIKDT